MMRGVVATLTAGAAVVSLASNVCAQSVGLNRRQSSNATLSVNSLSGIQSRSIEKDFPRYTYKTLPSSPRSNGTNQKSGVQALTGLLGNVGDRLEFGGVSDRSRTNGTPLPSEVGNGESDGAVKVRYRLNDK